MNRELRVLIVDDNEVCRTRDYKLLSKSYNCQLAENGFQAFKMIPGTF